MIAFDVWERYQQRNDTKTEEKTYGGILRPMWCCYGGECPIL